MLAIGRYDIAAALLRLEVVLAHQPMELSAVHHDALMAQSRADTAIAVTLEFIADRPDPDENFTRRGGDGRSIVIGRACQTHQFAPPADGDTTGPVTTEVVALLGRDACFKAPFSISISSACRPTIRSRAAILASYSWSRSAAWTSSSSAPASHLPTQIRIS